MYGLDELSITYNISPHSREKQRSIRNIELYYSFQVMEIKTIHFRVIRRSMLELSRENIDSNAIKIDMPVSMY